MQYKLLAISSHEMNAVGILMQPRKGLFCSLGVLFELITVDQRKNRLIIPFLTSFAHMIFEMEKSIIFVTFRKQSAIGEFSPGIMAEPSSTLPRDTYYRRLVSAPPSCFLASISLTVFPSRNLHTL